MKKHWFKKFSWIYIPKSWQGFLTTLILIAFCVQIFIFIDGKSHSVSDTLYGIFPYIVPTFLIYLWIASKNSQK
ncbi:MAG: hypothetical protein KKD18_04580 [Nanoarchaeota archaeon]|nr:hypothetical protein [Nanoarchaeota archaeon]